MPPFPIFVTATSATLPALNKALIHLDDWTTDQPRDFNAWAIIYSADLDQLDGDDVGEPPLAREVVADNTFAGKTPLEVNAWVRAHEAKLQEAGYDHDYWLVLDDEGLETATVLFAAQSLRPVFNEALQTEDLERTADCRWVRMSMDDAYARVMATWVGSIGFEESLQDGNDETADLPGEHVWGGTYGKSLDELERLVEQPKGRWTVEHSRGVLQRRLAEMARKQRYLEEARIQGWIEAD